MISSYEGLNVCIFFDTSSTEELGFMSPSWIWSLERWEEFVIVLINTGWQK